MAGIPVYITSHWSKVIRDVDSFGDSNSSHSTVSTHSDRIKDSPFGWHSCFNAFPQALTTSREAKLVSAQNKCNKNQNWKHMPTQWQLSIQSFGSTGSTYTPEGIFQAHHPCSWQFRSCAGIKYDLPSHIPSEIPSHIPSQSQFLGINQRPIKAKVFLLRQNNYTKQ